jgi:serine protease
LGNIAGTEFEMPSNQFWYNPRDIHGTHVTGTIVAQGGNGEGVVGVIPSNQGICLLIARVFADNVGSASTSSVNAGIEWCANNKARVINLSLGSSQPSPSQQSIIRRLVTAENILVVVAAGNAGDSSFSYPASHPEAISVAALTQSLARASYSQFNAEVDVAAPGSGILSTIPDTMREVQVTDSNGIVYAARLLDDSSIPTTPITANIVNCGLGDASCPGGLNAVCVMIRGSITFFLKAQNAQNSGCLAALIYNNVTAPTPFSGVLSSPGVTIPVASLTNPDGIALLATTTATLARKDTSGGSYATLQGTSMATPHVTGAIARIWAARPLCTNAQIREAIEKSASDLGALGRDDFTGAGLVQVEAAYQYLLQNFAGPCGTRATMSPTMRPTLSPATASPTMSPTVKKPTMRPMMAMLATMSPTMRPMRMMTVSK